MVRLRPYQKEILNDPRIVNILRHIEGKKERPEFMRPVVVSPTGTGKTAAFCAIANWCKDRKLRVLVLVHRKEIKDGTLREMYKLGITCGQIASGRPMTTDLIQVAMVGTLLKRLSLVKRPDVIITDECHHTPSKTYRQIHSFWSSVPVVGMTATPCRTDGEGLGKDYDAMILGRESSWHVEEGYLAVPVVFRPPDEVTAQYHIKRGDFDQAEQEAVMSTKKIVGDVITHYKKHMDGKPVIVSCVSVAHAKMMAEVFAAAGYKARAVWGDMADSDRDYAIQGLGDGRVQVVTFDSLIGEGVDIPAVTGVILLRRTLSLALYLQIVGRALRPVYWTGLAEWATDENGAKYRKDLETKEGRILAQQMGPKPRAIILDHAGNYQIHGHPLESRDWSLESQKKKVKGELPPTVTKCPKCYGVWPGKIRRCPGQMPVSLEPCGYSFVDAEFQARAQEIKVIEGELIEAGLGKAEAETEANWLARVMMMDGKKRQAAILGKTFELAEKENGRETVKALVDAMGYKTGYARWAWDFVQSKKKSK